MGWKYARLVGHVPPDVRESHISKGVGQLITGQCAIDQLSAEPTLNQQVDKLDQRTDLQPYG
jgi:hypothetical protein